MVDYWSCLCVAEKSLYCSASYIPRDALRALKAPSRCCSCCPRWPLTLMLPELPATPKTRLLPAGLCSHPGPQVVGPRSCQVCPLLTLPNPSLPRLTLSPSPNAPPHSGITCISAYHLSLSPATCPSDVCARTSLPTFWLQHL